MDFLSRRKSLAFTSSDTTTTTTTTTTTLPSGQLLLQKPLPKLPPGLKTNKMGAVENIPRKRPAASGSSSGIIRRVSSIFGGGRGGHGGGARGGRKKKPPPALKVVRDNNIMSSIYEARNASAHSFPRSDDNRDEEEDEEDDDIRPPSDLGDAASITSMPPSPFNPTYHHSVFNPDPQDGYVRKRASSTPHLLNSLSLRSLNLKRKNRDRAPSVASSSHTGHSHRQPPPPVPPPAALAPPPPPPPPPAIKTTTITSIPVETMIIILSHLPKPEVANLACTSRLFSSASRSLLYAHVDLEDLTHTQLEKFIALLAKRRDLTDLVRGFSCYTWPRFFLTTSSATSPHPNQHPSSFQKYHHHDHNTNTTHDNDIQHRDTLLTATFTLAFQRMSNLTSLTLPAFDRDLLVHHTAFGLCSITFMCTSLSLQESNELFAWLDGQTNITTLLFPHLTQESTFLQPEPSASSLSLSLLSSTSTSTSTSAAARPGNSPLVTAHHRPASSIHTLVVDPKSKGKYLVAPFLVPLSTSPSSSRSVSPSPSGSPKPTRAERPKSASPTSPIFSCFPSAISCPPPPELLSSPPSNSVPFPEPEPPSSYIHTPIHTPRAQLLPLSSPTLLPNLTTLHGPPSLIIALTHTHENDGSGGGGARPQTRPLKSVTMNITTTLYTGLRPAMIMNSLVGATSHLGLCFGENVDRRSVEKVLAAAGSALGGNANANANVSGSVSVGQREGEWEERKKREERMVFGHGFRFGGYPSAGGKRRSGGGEGGWKGLLELDVVFVSASPAVAPGSAETFHKIINSNIPRYPLLRVLRLSYAYRPQIPVPSSPTPTTTTSTTTLTVPSKTQMRALSPTSTASALSLLSTSTLSLPISSLLPSTPSSFVSQFSVTSTASSGTGKITHGTAEPPSPPEQAYIRQWIKHCPELRRVVFLSGTEWCRKEGRKE